MAEDPVIVCAGRTDAGVHARGQVVHVDLPDPLPAARGRDGDPLTAQDVKRAVNRQLAPSVVVREAQPAPAGFDARRAASRRHYRYLVHAAEVPDPLLAPLVWHVPFALDLQSMRAAADPLVGEHDFRSFCRRAPGTDPAEPVNRRVISADWSEVVGAPVDGRLLRFDIVATAFCHQMVRSIVGVLVAAGRGRGNAATVMELLAAGSRAQAAEPAPPHGLCLVDVAYADTVTSLRPTSLRPTRA
jgi:tRNA pseudouridine38-40 synthase